jgi:mannan endo-1,4-beta-mannosidase
VHYIPAKKLADPDTCACVKYSRSSADPDATENVKELLRKLYDMSQRKSVMFGQQNAGHIGISIDRFDGTDSDVKRIAGVHPSVVGIDALMLTGYEGTFKQAVQVTKQLHRENVIITLSMHAPNFAVCDDDFSGYSPNRTEPPIVAEIMPGGVYNARFLRYLDRIAEYAAAVTDDHGELIPVIFRPFHENNGSWFWWGREYCTTYEYKELFRYSILYLQKEKEIHNFLYAYSPNGPFADEAGYLSRYPGDDFVDIIGFDMYHDRPSTNDTWMDTLTKTCRQVCAIARDHHKVTAVTEAGIRMLDSLGGPIGYEGLSPANNPRPDWFEECVDAIFADPLSSEITYFLVWSNFSRNQFWTPYIIDETHGHEMINEFTEFLNDPRVILAGEQENRNLFSALLGGEQEFIFGSLGLAPGESRRQINSCSL